MSQYKAQANGAIKPAIQQFFESFYAISDTPDDHEKYSQQFTKNAKLIIASNEANGREGTGSEIMKMRTSMWEKVAKRSHEPKVIYAGASANDVMLYGTVGYTLKDGKEASVDWAARAHLVEEDWEWKMDFYQVYLDSAAMARAK
ncbi:Hypothetical protein R9X50_00118800 [Acrodontium crateriforme]|uniref:SnoaL-like domain-containing protein n=1 Tax=Acrodontium crateriforme TaxID=150365 RepID=A0AAQ3LYN1_9PEZI|nr:Hypothetical protein R9X50_00118800 [Acrodontium crateriforme]